MSGSNLQRNSRCKDFKVKRALQICVLLGVCIWMVYLVQHSHGKRTSFEENTKTSDEVGKLGRKDPNPNVDQSSIINARRKEENDENKNEYEEQNKTNNVNGAEDEMLELKNEKYEHGEDPEDQNTEKSVVSNQENEENRHKTNKEDKDNKGNFADNQPKEIGEETIETEKEETIETETNSKEDEEIYQDKTEVKKDMEGNNNQKDKDDSNLVENEEEENDEIHESSKDRVNDQDKERNDEEAGVEHYTSNVVGLNKTKQSDRRENNEFELVSQTNSTEVAHLAQNEKVLNVTQSKATQVDDSVVTTTNQGEGSENEKNNDSQMSSIAESYERHQEHNKPSIVGVETLHSQNNADMISNTSENFKVEGSNLHNTILKMNNSKSDVIVGQVDSTLTNSSRSHKSNATNEEYNGKDNANDNGHNGVVNASNSSILEEKDVSSKNNDEARQVENDENINTSENEVGAQNEQVERQN